MVNSGPYFIAGTKDVKRSRMEKFRKKQAKAP